MTFREAIAKAQRDYLNELLVETGGNVKVAARLAGINRSVIYRYLAQGKCELPRVKYAQNRGNWQELGA